MYFSKNKTFDVLFLLLTTTLAFHFVVSINEDDIAEICPGNFITQDYNTSWENTRDFTPEVTYFFPMASKFGLFSLSQYLYQTRNFKLITESQLENSCLIASKIDGWERIKLTGYDKVKPVQIYRTNIPKLFRFDLSMPDGSTSGYASIALTDNETYIVFDYCYDNGLRSFMVASTSVSLDEVSVAVIKAHLKSIGFKERNFVYTNYLACFDTQGNVAPDPEDLPIPAPTYTRTRYPSYLSDNFLYPTFFYKKK